MAENKSNENIKEVNDKELEKVDGGMLEAYRKANESLNSLIPFEVKEQLKNAKNDVEFCSILAKNGVDVEKVEEKIKEAGFDINTICLQELPLDKLEKVAGGFELNQQLIYCRCGNEDRDEFSWQFFASRFHSSASLYDIYRCKKCNTYIKITSDYFIYIDEDGNLIE